MRCAIKRGPTADHWRLQPELRNHFTRFDPTMATKPRTVPDDDGRVLAILAMGSNGVPPLLVRRAIDERWSVDEAARAFSCRG